MAWNQHQHRDHWAAGGTQLAVCTHFEKCCALSGGLSRPSGSEATPPPRGRFCPSKLWASRHTRQTELPPPRPRDQWSFGKESKTRTKGCQASACRREEEEQQQPPPEQILGRCSSGAPSRHSIRENHSVCNTRCTVIIQDVASAGRSCSGEAAPGFEAGETDVEPLVLRSWFPRRILSWLHRTA